MAKRLKRKKSSQTPVHSAPSKLALISLGCAKNLVDSEIMLAKLALAGYELVVDEASAEVIIVNTCGFIDLAKQESIETIREVSKLKYSGNLQTLAVTGCLSQRYQDDLRESLPDVDVFTGVNDYHRIVELLAPAHPQATQFSPTLLDYRGELPRLQVTPFYSAYLKVAEGCSKTCTFCVIPEIRGAFRSRLVDEVVREAQGLAANGVVEVNLIAQEITSFGKDLGTGADFPLLLRKLHAIDGIRWIRILYNYPTELSGEIVATYADLPKICPYIDLPLQHINDRILRLMKRGSRKDSTLNLLERIRSTVPQVAIRSSFIAGFPGETEQEFAELLDFVRSAGFHRLSAFRYSPEEGSVAAGLPGQLADEVREERYAELCAIRDEATRQWNEGQLGTEQEVLVEGPVRQGDSTYIGRLATQAPEIDGVVYLQQSSDSNLEAGAFISATLRQADSLDFAADLEAAPAGSIPSAALPLRILSSDVGSLR